MAYNNGLITAPVSIHDVQQALGISGGGDLATLCKSDRINIWAKYKPVDNTSIHYMGQLNLTTKQWKSDATWFHGKGQNWRFGLSPWSVSGSGSTTLAQLIAKYNAIDDMNGWVYHAPTGGSTSPYRLTDFNEYNHNAQSFASDFVVGSPVGIDGSTLKGMLIASYLHAADDGTNITPYNLLGVNTYFGVVMTKSDGTIVLHGTTNSVDVTVIQQEITFPANSEGQTYYVYPFLAVNSEPQFNNVYIANTYYTLPLLSRASLQVVIKSQTIRISVAGEYGAQGTDRTIVVITITADVAYSNCWIELVNGDQGTNNVTLTWSGNNATGHATVSGLIQTTPRFTLSAGVTYTIIITGLNANTSYNGKLYVNGTITDYKRFGIMEVIQ